MTKIRVSEHGGYICEGTISHGTLRPQDLLRAFADEYGRLMPFGSQSICNDAYEMANRLDSPNPTADSYDDIYECASETINELHDAINEAIAPHGFYFGNTDGDGAEFGIWRCDEDDYDH